MIGFSDPFNLPVQTDKEISERLGCKFIELKRDKDEDEKIALCLPTEKARECLGLFNKWVLCCPAMHTPSRTPKEDQLTLIKAIHLVDHVLRIMFDLQYKRQGKAIKKENKGNKTRIHQYGLQNSHDFTRFKQDLSHEKGKPILPAWEVVSPGDLHESDILAVEGVLVQPAASFRKRQSRQCSLKYLPGIEEGHIRPLKIQKNA